MPASFEARKRLAPKFSIHAYGGHLLPHGEKETRGDPAQVFDFGPVSEVDADDGAKQAVLELVCRSDDQCPAGTGCHFTEDAQGTYPTLATSASVSICFPVELTAGSPRRWHIVTAQSASSRQYSG